MLKDHCHPPSSRPRRSKLGAKTHIFCLPRRCPRIQKGRRPQPAPPSGAAAPENGNHGGPRTTERPHTRAEEWPGRSQATSTIGADHAHNRPASTAPKPDQARVGPRGHRRIRSRRSSHRRQPTRPSRRPTATSPRLHAKRRRQRGSPGARSAADSAPATTRSMAEASSSATLPRSCRPGVPRRSSAHGRRPQQRARQPAPPRRVPPRSLQRRGRPPPSRRWPAIAAAKGSSGWGIPAAASRVPPCCPKRERRGSGMARLLCSLFIC
jgi:hypothetical protein